MDKLGLGMIGCGWAARYLHMESFKESIEPKAVCCRTKQNLDKFKKDFNFNKAYTDFMDLLEDRDVDVVVVCTPASTRLEIIEPAAKLGKHLFVEKPLAWGCDEAMKAVEVCDKYGVKLAIADQYRFFPHIEKAAKIMEDGLLGVPFTGLLETMNYFDFPAYPGQKRGFVIEMITHNIDLLRYIIGIEAAEVYAKMGRSPSKQARGEVREFWDTITITFEGGCIVQLFNSWDCWGFNIPAGRPEGRMHLECDKGTLFMNKDDDNVLTYYSSELEGWVSPKITPAIKKEEMEAYGTGQSMRSFLKCIEEDSEHLVSGKEHLKTLEIAFAAYKSAAENRPIKL